MGVHAWYLKVSLTYQSPITPLATPASNFVHARTSPPATLRVVSPRLRLQSQPPVLGARIRHPPRSTFVVQYQLAITPQLV